MKPINTTSNFQIDLASESKDAPLWVELFPVGSKIIARDGRSWNYEPQKLIKAFAANNAPLPIDYEHGQDHLAIKGHAAPAAGWIVELQDRGGALWGKVEWTKKAAKLIIERAYRFISPAFTHQKDGEITRLLGAGLVNRPALEMTALSREQQSPTNNEKEQAMLKAIAKALGLDETSDEKAILAELAKRNKQTKSLCAALGLKEDDNLETANVAVKSLDEKHSKALASLETAADGSEFEALRQQLTDTQTTLASLQKDNQTKEIDTLIDAQVLAGKITPASKEQYRAMCASDDGIEKFKALAATLPVICEPSKLDGKKPNESQVDDNVDPVALAAQANKYKDEQLTLGREISTAQAIEEIKEKTQ